MKPIFHTRAENLLDLNPTSFSYIGGRNKDGSYPKKDFSKRVWNKKIREAKITRDDSPTNRTKEEKEKEKQFISEINITKEKNSLTVAQFLDFWQNFSKGNVYEFKGITFTKLKTTNPIKYFAKRFKNLYDELKHGFSYWQYRDTLFNLNENKNDLSEFELFNMLYKKLFYNPLNSIPENITCPHCKTDFTYPFRNENPVETDSFIDSLTEKLATPDSYQDLDLYDFIDKICSYKINVDKELFDIASNIILQELEWKIICQTSDWKRVKMRNGNIFKKYKTDFTLYLLSKRMKSSDPKDTQIEWFRSNTSKYKTFNGETILPEEFTRLFNKSKDSWNKYELFDYELYEKKFSK